MVKVPVLAELGVCGVTYMAMSTDIQVGISQASFSSFMQAQDRGGQTWRHRRLRPTQTTVGVLVLGDGSKSSATLQIFQVTF